MSPEDAEKRSWHSWRVTLACSLRAARDEKHPDGRSLTLVKVFGRWRSDSAVELYGRLDPDAYAGHVSASLAADAASINAPRTAEAMDNIDPPLFESMAAEQDDADTDASGDEGSSRSASSARAAARPEPARGATKAVKAPSKRARKRASPALPLPKRQRGPAGALCVLVPASCFPEERCEENGGEGWDAFAVPRSRGAASVTFQAARDSSGLPFRPILLQRSVIKFQPSPT